MPPPLLTPTAYFPPYAWLLAARQAGGWVIEAHENYQKRSPRHRCRILGPNGPLPLSVPLVKGKHAALPIREVAVSYDRPWAREHLRSLRAAYGRSPYFEYYAEPIFAVLHDPPPHLWTLNERLLTTVLDLLDWPVRPGYTDQFIPEGTGDFLRPAELPDVPPYPQVFTDRFGFTGGLSVLDALFCLGPAA